MLQQEKIEQQAADLRRACEVIEELLRALGECERAGGFNYPPGDADFERQQAKEFLAAQGREVQEVY